MFAPAALTRPAIASQALEAFDGARPGDHRQRSAADLDRADLDDRVVTVQFPAGELERLEDRQHLLDAGDGGQRFRLQLVLVADDADDRAMLALAVVRLKPSSRMRSRMC